MGKEIDRSGFTLIELMTVILIDGWVYTP